MNRREFLMGTAASIAASAVPVACEYEAVMRVIVFNHVALIDGCGPRIADPKVYAFRFSREPELIGDGR